MEKKNVYNIIAALLAFAINLLLQFFLSPYIIQHIGIEAYGFIALANNAVVVIDVFMIAINSMCSRFVALAIHRNDEEAASEYYATVFWCNIIFLIILIVGTVIVLSRLNSFLDIPLSLYWDVQLLFLCIIGNFGASMFGALFSVSYIVRNKLYLSSIVQIKATCLKGGAILGLYILFSPYVFFYGLGILISTLYMRVWDCYYKNQLIQEVSLRISYFNLIRLKELVSAGFFNLVIRVGGILSLNLDILMVSFFLGATATGIFGLAKLIPNILSGVAGALSNAFFPNLLELYAKRELKQLYKVLFQEMKLYSLIFSIPIIVILAFGDVFFQLWVPTQDSHLLYVLSTILIFPVALLGPLNLIYNIFPIVNCLKWNALALLIAGIINCAGTYLILHFQWGGLILIALFPNILNPIRDLCFTIPYGAVCIHLKWYEFYKIQLQSITCLVVVIGIGIFIKYVRDMQSWIELIVGSLLIVVIDISWHLLFIYDKSDRELLWNAIQSRIRM